MPEKLDQIIKKKKGGVEIGDEKVKKKGKIIWSLILIFKHVCKF